MCSVDQNLTAPSNLGLYQLHLEACQYQPNVWQIYLSVK